MTYIQLSFQNGAVRFRESTFAIPLLILVFALSLGTFTKLGPIMSLMWACVYLVAATWFGLTAQRTLLIMIKNWPLLLLPLIALSSVTWSSDPFATLRTGIQFSFSTVLAIRLADALGPREALKSLFVATGIGLALSGAAFVVPTFQPLFENNGAFVGAYAQKTVAGVAFSLLALSTIGVFSLIGLKWVGLLFAFAFVPVILLTKSVSAVILLCGIMILIFQGLPSSATATRRFATLVLLVGSAITLTIGIWLSDFDVVESFLSLAGKDRSLTGRTEIWELGFEIANSHPILGTGYAAFWNNPHYSEFWGYLHATVDPRLKGFHNLYIEALATTGIFGLVGVVVTYYWIALRALSWFIESGRIVPAFWGTIVLCALMLSFVDNVLFGEHEFFHIVAVMVFVFSGKRETSLKFRMSSARQKALV